MLSLQNYLQRFFTDDVGPTVRTHIRLTFTDIECQHSTEGWINSQCNHLGFAQPFGYSRESEHRLRNLNRDKQAERLDVAEEPENSQGSGQ